MNPTFPLFLTLFTVAIAALVRCWWKPDAHFIGWILLALFSTLGAIAAQ